MKLLREFVFSILESKIDDLKAKYPQDSELIDNLASVEPSGKQKYLTWLYGQVKAGANINDVVPSLRYFHQNNQRFANKDINSYDARSLEDNVKELELSTTKSQARKQTKIEGADKIFENDQRLLMRMFTKRACMIYGSGTKWCITMENADYYESYVKRGVKFYFLIEKNLNKDDPRAKIAFAVYPTISDEYGLKFETFDANDDPLPDDEYPEIIDLIDKDMSNVSKQEELVKAGKGTPQEALRYLQSNLSTVDLDILHTILKSHNISDKDLFVFIDVVLDDSSKLKLIIRSLSYNGLVKLALNNENSLVRYIALSEIFKVEEPKLENWQWVKLSTDEDADNRIIVSRHLKNNDILRTMMDDDYHGVRANVAMKIDIDSVIEMLKTERNHNVKTVLVDRLFDEKSQDEVINILKQIKQQLETRY